MNDFSFLMDSQLDLDVDFHSDFVSLQGDSLDVPLGVQSQLESEKQGRKPINIISERTPKFIVELIEKAANSWLGKEEIHILLLNFQVFGLEILKKVPQFPGSGSVIFYNRKTLKNFRNDGYSWLKGNNKNSAKESHVKLTIKGEKKLACYYATHQMNQNFRRRVYWLLDDNSFVLVHYLDESEYIEVKKNEKVAKARLKELRRRERAAKKGRKIRKGQNTKYEEARNVQTEESEVLEVHQLQQFANSTETESPLKRSSCSSNDATSIEIVDVSPSVAYTNGGTKMLICLSSPIEGTLVYAAFNEKRVVTQNITPQTLRCIVPSMATAGEATLRLTWRHNDDAASSKIMFAYYTRASPAVTPDKLMKPSSVLGEKRGISVLGEKRGIERLTIDSQRDRTGSDLLELDQREFKIRIVERLGNINSAIRQQKQLKLSPKPKSNTSRKDCRTDATSTSMECSPLHLKKRGHSLNNDTLSQYSRLRETLSSLQSPENSKTTQPPLSSSYQNSTTAPLLSSHYSESELQILNDEELENLNDEALSEKAQGLVTSVIEDLVKFGQAHGMLQEINVLDHDGFNLLHYIVLYNRPQLLTLVLKNGANPNRPSKSGHSPLHLAAQAGLEEVVRELLKYGADPAVQNHEMQTPADRARLHGFPEIANLLGFKNSPENRCDYHHDNENMQDMLERRVLADTFESMNLHEKCALSLGVSQSSEGGSGGALSDSSSETCNTSIDRFGGMISDHDSVVSNVKLERVSSALSMMSEEERRMIEGEASIIQRSAQAWLLRRNYRKLRDVTITMQALLRGARRRRGLRQEKDAAVRIATMYKEKLTVARARAEQGDVVETRSDELIGERADESKAAKVIVRGMKDWIKKAKAAIALRPTLARNRTLNSQEKNAALVIQAFFSSPRSKYSGRNLKMLKTVVEEKRVKRRELMSMDIDEKNDRKLLNLN
eukprot:g2030.t1